MRTPARTRHLIFLAHMWALSPFVFLWMLNPTVARQLAPEDMAHVRTFALIALVYVLGRTIIAWRNPKWVQWEYVFPPIDVILITVFLHLADRDPLGNITIMYFLPIAEAAGTLNVIWAGLVGLMCIAGSMVGSFGNTTEPAYNIAFRFVFLVVMASLFTFLARMAADFRAQLQVAKDRNRLALEMHDGVQAHLISASAQMELIQHLTAGRATELAKESRGTLREAADELRFLVQRMRAPSRGEGFLPALQHYAHNFCERFGLTLAFETEGDSPTLTAEQENAIFRIIQEALNNVVKHAQASNVRVCVSFDPSVAEIEISDDGKGIAGTHEGVGFDSMRERAAAERGTVTIEAVPAGGTLVRARLGLGGRKRG